MNGNDAIICEYFGRGRRQVIPRFYGAAPRQPEHVLYISGRRLQEAEAREYASSLGVPRTVPVTVVLADGMSGMFSNFMDSQGMDGDTPAMNEILRGKYEHHIEAMQATLLKSIRQAA